MIAWSSDLSGGCHPLLQYWLVTVYAEYCATKETYQDLLEALLPRFNELSKVDPVLNPWCAHGIRFILCGVQGDLKWLNSHHSLHNYMSNSCCSRCDAVKAHEDPRKSIMCFTEDSTAAPITHEQWCASHDLDAWPLPMVHGVRLERFVHDVAHSQLLGTGKTLNGSCLIYLCESGEFNATGQFPTQGMYEQNLQAALRVAYLHFKNWVKDSGLKVNQPRFTCSRLNRKNRMSHPLLASKAVSGKVLSFWLAGACSARAARPQATQDDALVATTIWHYASMLKRMDLGPIVLSAEEAGNIYKDGMIHLRTYAMLRGISASRKRGRMPLRSMFTLLPKHHHLKHALQDARDTRVNPNAYNLLAAESFVGDIGKISRMQSST